MADYKKIAEEALKKAMEIKKMVPNKPINILNESLVYPEGMSERMHPKLEDELRKQETSLGKHPIFPEGDEDTFEQKIMGHRFSEVSKRYKTAHSTDSIDSKQAMKELLPLVNDVTILEGSHKKELEALAIKVIREEFDMGEDVVEIHAELTTQIDIEGTRKNPSPQKSDMDFKNHDEMVKSKDEVYKRRFVNAMIQGAAKKCNHMFHVVHDELADIDPKLNNLYSKMMSTADYMYYIIPNMDDGVNGGVVRVDFPTKTNPKIVIHAQAMVFPVLIHELVKGVMEILSAKGLPKGKMGKFVLDKADFLSAEPWDMRIGPALWGRFTDMFEVDDFKLKHHVWSELVELPVEEFNIKMREIMSGTKEGKKIIQDLVDVVKNDLSHDDFNDAMDAVELETNESVDAFDWNELMDDDEDNGEEGYDDIDELFK